MKKKRKGNESREGAWYDTLLFNFVIFIAPGVVSWLAVSFIFKTWPLTIHILIGVLMSVIVGSGTKAYNARKNYEARAREIIEYLDILKKWKGDAIPIMLSLATKKRLSKLHVDHLSNVIKKAAEGNTGFLQSSIYLMRSLSPDIILEGSPSKQLFLFRTIAETRAIAPNDQAARTKFNWVQEEDYTQLFEFCSYSYYVTSYKDLETWIIWDRKDLDYFFENYRRNRQLQSLNRKKSMKGAKNYQLEPGIHRIFILPKVDISKDILDGFIAGLDPIIKGKEKYDASRLCKALNISQEITESEFKAKEKIKVLFALLAAKIHEHLDIDFGVIFDDSPEFFSKRECLMLQEEKMQDEWRCLDWECLGSAMFDYSFSAGAYVTRQALKNKKEEPKVTQNKETAIKFPTIMYYKFDLSTPGTFCVDVVDLIDTCRKYSEIRQHKKYMECLQGLNDFAVKLTKKIKKAES